MANRGKGGRFLPGHSVKSPGNPKARMAHAVAAAIRNAISPDEIVGVIRSLYLQALSGDSLAARILLERVCGRPREEAHHPDVDLGPFGSASDLTLAMSGISDALKQGRISVSEAEALFRTVDVASNVFERASLEARIAKLEQERFG
jgi:hypothetical protein